MHLVCVHGALSITIILEKSTCGLIIRCCCNNHKQDPTKKQHPDWGLNINWKWFVFIKIVDINQKVS